MTQIKRVLGLDPGLSTFGWALLRRRKKIKNMCLDVGLFESKPDKKLVYYDDYYRRLSLLQTWLTDVVRTTAPEAIAVEAFSYPRQARAAVYLAGSHSVARSVAESFDIPIIQIKRSYVLSVAGVQVVGKGRAARRKSIKEGVIAFCNEHWGDLENWPNAKTRREHPADAAATAYTLLTNYALQHRLFEDPLPDLICSFE